MSYHKVICLGTFFACAVHAFGEEPLDTPRAVHDRIDQAAAAGDVKSWKAEQDPDSLAEQKKWFEEDVLSGKLGPKDLKWIAEGAGVSEEELKGLSWDQYLEKTIAPRKKVVADEALIYLATHLEGRAGREEKAEIEWLTHHGSIRREEYRRVGGRWKFVQIVTQLQLLLPRKTIDEVCDDWKRGILAADGRRLLETYSSEVRISYLRAWGPELGKILEGGSEKQEAAARELGVESKLLLSLRAQDYVERRLSIVLSRWLEQGENREKLSHAGWGEDDAGNTYAIRPIKGIDLPPLEMVRDQDWRISADFLSKDRESLKK